MCATKNYYIALRFKGKPSVHLTLRYFKGLSPEDVAELIKRVEKVMGKFQGKRFDVLFAEESWFGPQNTVRVLECRPDYPWPQWVTLLSQMTGGDSTYAWHPHIATKKAKSLDVTVTAVSVICKKTEVARWELS